jgi:hypothetical protein
VLVTALHAIVDRLPCDRTLMRLLQSSSRLRAEQSQRSIASSRYAGVSALHHAECFNHMTRLAAQDRLVPFATYTPCTTRTFGLFGLVMKTSSRCMSLNI